MAEVYPIQFRGVDREPFAEWLAKCQEAGAAQTMTDAIRLAVRLAMTIPTDQLPKAGT
jgi:hypothetical protein